MRYINSTDREGCIKRAQIITRHSEDFQTKVVQSKGWLSAIVCCSMAKINDLWDGSMDKRKVRSLVPCCGQDGNLAQEPQHHRVIQHLTSCTYME